MANVAAIDCDEESNKSICGKYEIKGFPTLKVMRAKVNKSGGRSVSVEDYNGQRTLKAIAEHITSVMPSTVQKVNDDSLQSFLAQANETAKVVLFTKKGATSSIFKALSTSFGTSFKFAQIRDTQSASVKTFGINEFPTLLLLPGGGDPSIVYQGDMKLPQLKNFLSRSIGLTENSDANLHKDRVLKHHKDPGSEAEASTGSPGSVIKTLTETSEVDNLLFGNTIKTALLLPVGLSTRPDLTAKSQDLPYLLYTHNAGQRIQKILGITGDTMVFVNCKKAWFVAAQDLPSTASAVHEFIDKVKQGEAGKKVNYSAPADKTEL
ncbi:Putative uncharacterized protein [Taphrina deformans PYCC 5710]|uniref:Thioredoxin domain-containing protein n=1 Tax=Taphrina deformans (strain PYCC 5710 / ATCC 11124 / CBS 356.35 / IMI 108563 / JCM 9778 / NBRC 8474) TaxID=1097556 RepID=R4X854_TAPDE|nr:Putative uncharacterized protein [Taphrina deformans PYCC 5710]|eukprot:CCG81699.1 Putative uncharacterized protein [Taphrina deformans PYCC 5710]